jgi:hypothetical protein
MPFCPYLISVPSEGQLKEPCGSLRLVLEQEDVCPGHTAKLRTSDIYLSAQVSPS